MLWSVICLTHRLSVCPSSRMVHFRSVVITALQYETTMLEVESSGHCGRMTTTTPEVAETVRGI